MANLYSIGEMIDKLIIENIKIYQMREKMHVSKVNDDEFADLSLKIITSNQNRSTLVKFLNDKIEDVISGQPNSFINDIRTYEIKKKKSK